MKTDELTTRLIKAAANFTGLDPSRIHGKGRVTACCEARWACWNVMREKGLTLQEIADAFRRNHGTIMHGLKASKMNHGNRDKHFRELCKAVEESINIDNL